MLETNSLHDDLESGQVYFSDLGPGFIEALKEFLKVKGEVRSLEAEDIDENERQEGLKRAEKSQRLLEEKLSEFELNRYPQVRSALEEIGQAFATLKSVPLADTPLKRPEAQQVYQHLGQAHHYLRDVRRQVAES